MEKHIKARKKVADMENVVQFRILQINDVVLIQHNKKVYNFQMNTLTLEVLSKIFGDESDKCFFQHSFGRIFHPCCPIEICLHYGQSLITPDCTYKLEEMAPDYLWINLCDVFSFKFCFSMKKTGKSTLKDVKEFITHSNELKHFLNNYDEDKEKFKLYDPEKRGEEEEDGLLDDKVTIYDYVKSRDAFFCDYEILVRFDEEIEKKDAKASLPADILSQNGSTVGICLYNQYIFKLPLISSDIRLFDALSAVCQNPFISSFFKARDKTALSNVFYFQSLDFLSSTRVYSPEFLIDMDLYDVVHLRTPSYMEGTAQTAAMNSSLHATIPLRSALNHMCKSLRLPTSKVTKFLTDMELDGIFTLGEFYAVVDHGFFNIETEVQLSAVFKLMKLNHPYLHMNAIKEHLLTEKTYMEFFLQAFKPDFFNNTDEMQEFLIRILDRGIYTVEDFVSKVIRPTHGSRRSSEPNIFLTLAPGRSGRRSSVIGSLKFQPMKTKEAKVISHLHVTPSIGSVKGPTAVAIGVAPQGKTESEVYMPVKYDPVSNTNGEAETLPFGESDPDLQILKDTSEKEHTPMSVDSEVDMEKPPDFDEKLADYVSKRYHSRRFSEPSAGKNMRKFLKAIENGRKVVTQPVVKPPPAAKYMEVNGSNQKKKDKNADANDLVKEKIELIFRHTQGMLNFSSSTPVYQFLGSLACRIQRSTSLTVKFADRLMSSRIYSVGELKARFNSMSDHTSSELFSDCSLLLLVEMKRYFSSTSKFMNIISKLILGGGINSKIIVNVENVHESVRGWYLYKVLKRSEHLSNAHSNSNNGKKEPRRKSRLLRVRIDASDNEITKSFSTNTDYGPFSDANIMDDVGAISLSSSTTTVSIGSLMDMDGRAMKFNIFYHNKNSEFHHLSVNDFVFASLSRAERVYIADAYKERILVSISEERDSVDTLLDFSLFSQPVFIRIENASEFSLSTFLKRLTSIIPFSTRLADEVARDSESKALDLLLPLPRVLKDVKYIDYGGLNVYVSQMDRIVPTTIAYVLNSKAIHEPKFTFFEEEVDMSNFSLNTGETSVLDEIVPLLGRGHRLKKKDLTRLLKLAIQHFDAQPNVLEITVTEERGLTILGDTHGQFFDLLKVFEENGYPDKNNRYLLNGDYVDRGPYGTEILTLLLSYKLNDPSSVYMLRGNHESSDIVRAYGFHRELMSKYGNDTQLFDLVLRFFSSIPVSALINGKILVVHGGLSRDPNLSIDEIRKMNRFHVETDGDSLLTSLLWSDPSIGMGLCASPRLAENAVLFGANHTLSFVEKNNLQLLIRSHEMKDEGFELMHHGRLVTLFSAPHYVDRDNLGAYIRCALRMNEYDEEVIVCEFVQFNHLAQIPTFVLANQKKFQTSECVLL